MDIWKYDSTDTAEYLYLHDCDCRHIYGCDNKLIPEMEWMEILETHSDNPYNEAMDMLLSEVQLPKSISKNSIKRLFF